MSDTIKTVGIVGLGLIGGSMAKAVRKFTDCKILGIDKNQETMHMAKMSGTIDEDLTNETVSECDLIMIAITPAALVTWVKENAKYFREDAILVDLCGIKSKIYKDVSSAAKKAGFLYVGGHPMAGKEVAGFTNASPELWSNASMILTPDETSDIKTLDMLKEFYMSLGFGSIVFSTPEEHDRIIAYTSQLAHVTSSAYIKSPTSRSYMGFSAGSYKDMTRVARLDPDMWTELFLDNAENLETELAELIKNLEDYLSAIKSRDKERLHELLKEGLDIKLTEKDEVL